MSDKVKNIVFLSSQHGYFMRELLDGVSDFVKEKKNWSLTMIPVDELTQTIGGTLYAQGVDGVIARGVSAALMNEVRMCGIPCVSLRGGDPDSFSNYNGPHTDDHAVARTVAETFHELGLKHVGFINKEGIDWSERRMNAFNEIASQLGMAVDGLTLSQSNRDNKSNSSKIQSWLSEVSKPIGVLVCHDQVGLEVLYACKLLDVKIPDEVSVIGIDNDELFCQLGSPSLSSVDLETKKIGFLAAAQLENLMLQEEKNTIEVPAPRLVVRASSHRVDNQLLVCQRARDILSTSHDLAMSVEDLAEQCGVSRKGLERALRQYGHPSPGKLIREARISYIINLLENENESIESLAPRAGFADAAGLFNFVKRHTGNTISYYRK